MISTTRNGASFRTYGYDEQGNTASITENGQTRTFTWNQDNRLTSINLPGTTADPSYAYNGAGTRVSRTLSGATQTWKRSGAGVTASVLSDGTNDFSPFSNSRANGQSTFWHTSLKNVVAQSQGASLSATKEYDAFGNSTNTTGAWQTPFGYAGEFGYQESDASLKLLGHRYYDSETGRFLSRDPIKDGRNWYVYCEHNPISCYDDQGLRLTWLYAAWKKVGDAFELVRFGTTRDLPRRNGETKRRFGKDTFLRPIASYEDDIPEGTKHGPQNKHALADERMLVEEMGGVGNHEPWSRSVKGGFLIVFGLLTLDPETAANGLIDLVEPHTDQAGRGYRDWNWGGRAGLSRGTLYNDIFGS